jgi:hypothetical protein
MSRNADSLWVNLNLLTKGLSPKRKSAFEPLLVLAYRMGEAGEADELQEVMRRMKGRDHGRTSSRKSR